MGIPAYFSHIVRNYAEISLKLDKFKRTKNIKLATNFYLDCNGIIYDVVSTGISEPKEIISGVITKIENYIKDMAPNGAVFIAFDGVAPVAKLNQQRIRRYKTAYESKVFNTNKGFATANITPGTKFMDTLANKLTTHFTKYTVTTSNYPGEGEHKIFDHIRTYGRNSINVVYGLDADLIMLSLCNLQYAPLIYLYRETPHYISSLNAELEPNEKYLFNIPMLSKIIYEHINPAANTATNNTLCDYVLLCFMLGNDFMPHIPSINIRNKGIHVLTNAYKKIGCNLTNNNRIVWCNIRKLMGVLAEQEEKNLQNEHASRDKYEAMKLRNCHSMTPEEKYNAIPIFNREIELLIDPDAPAWQSRYYKYLFAMSADKYTTVVENYLEGLEWTFKYYTSGCPDWRWCYKYDYAPLLTDIYRDCNYFEHEYFKNGDINGPISKEAQLMYVLPPDYHYLLEEVGIMEKYEDLKVKGIIKESNSDELSFAWAYCTYLWEAHVHLDKISPELFEVRIKY